MRRHGVMPASSDRVVFCTRRLFMFKHNLRKFVFYFCTYANNTLLIHDTL